MAGPGMHQSQNLSLQQVLAPQLQQSLLILQAPLLELRNLVQQEMETNPVLEELPTEPAAEGTEEPATPTVDEEFKAEFDQLAKLDDEWRDYMAQSGTYSARSQEDEEKRQFFFDSIATQETLQQHLMGQLNQAALDATIEKLPSSSSATLMTTGSCRSPRKKCHSTPGSRRMTSKRCFCSFRASIRQASARATCASAS
jgi:RNA polymerase sigma-54 factor